MTDRELMQVALDALEWCYDVTEWPANGKSAQDKAVEALRARLAQPEPEPAAWYYAGSRVEPVSVALDCDLDAAQKANCTPLYTAPPQREWQELTDEEITETLKRFGLGERAALARAIEAALKAKNG